MNLNNSLKILGVGVILTILIFVGIHIYVRWDIQRFANNLNKEFTFDVSPKSGLQRDMMKQKRVSQIPPSTTVELKRLSSGPLVTEKLDVEIGESPPAERHVPVPNIELDVPNLSTSTVELPPALAAEPVEGIDYAKAAFRDYNDFLEYDPENAYTRLADGLREELGDHPEVDILVETIKRANNSNMTVDDAIAMQEALLRIMPENEYETIKMLSDHLITLEAIKALQAEGEKIEIVYNFKIRY